MSSSGKEVFISYHRGTLKACKLAKELHDRLEVLKWKPFLDERSVAEGDDWAKEIYTSLFRCSAAIILLSRAGMKNSEWLCHEVAILMGRYGRWTDLVIIPVLLDDDIDPSEAVVDRRFRALSRIQFVCGRNSVDATSILDALERQWSRLRPRLMRHHFVQAMFGVRNRAVGFQKQVARLLPAKEVLAPLLTSRALGLPHPPRNTSVDVRWYIAGLLLIGEAPTHVIEVIQQQGSQADVNRLARFLKRRGLVAPEDRMRWALTRRFFWSLRLCVAGATVLSAVATVVLWRLVVTFAGKAYVGRAVLVAAAVVVPVAVLTTVGFRLLTLPFLIDK